jgi:hypothetical protein
MNDEGAEVQQKKFFVQHGKVIKRPEGHSRGMRPGAVDKSDELRVRDRIDQETAQTAADTTFKEVEKGVGQSLETEGLPLDWAFGLGKARFVSESPGYQRPMTRTGQPGQRPTLSGQTLEKAQKEMKQEQMIRHFGSGSRRYGK